MSEESKKKFPLWIYPENMKLVKKIYKDDNCSSQSEFIEKAIVFYCGYLASGDHNKYLLSVITSTIKGIVAESNNKTNRLLFKMAVELAMTMNVLATLNGIEQKDLIKLRGSCVEEVKGINGSLSLDGAVKWQK